MLSLPRNTCACKILGAILGAPEGPEAHPWMSSGSTNSGFCDEVWLFCVFYACLPFANGRPQPSVPSPVPRGSSFASQGLRTLWTPAHSHTVLHLPLGFIPSDLPLGMPFLPNSSCFWAPGSSLQKTFSGTQSLPPGPEHLPYPESLCFPFLLSALGCPGELTCPGH